jgi:hypothetical protein
MTLTGKGKQRFLSQKYEDKRRRGLLDDENIESSLHDWYGISGAAGGGSTDPKYFERKQNPYPVDQSIRKKKTIDIRDLPWIG